MTLSTVTSEQNETYELRREELRGVSKYSRRMKRSGLARFLRSREKEGVIQFYSYEDGVLYLRHLSADSVKFPDRLELGCQYFSGDNLKKLKKWALAKSK